MFPTKDISCARTAVTAPPIPPRRPRDGARDADRPPVLVQLPLLLVEVGALSVDVADQLLVTLVYYLKLDGIKPKFGP